MPARSWGILACAALATLRGVVAAEHRVAAPGELPAVVKQARPGDTIVLAAGTWNDADLVFEAEGTAEQPITLRAETPGQTVFTGHSRLRIGGRHLVVDGLAFTQVMHEDDLICFRRDSKRLAEHCRVTNCSIVNRDMPVGTVDSHWVSIYGHHNRFDHCRLEGKTNKGTTLAVWLTGEPNEHRIDHNYFGPRPELKKNGGETIRVGDSKTSLTNSRTVVERNLFVECNGEAEIISNKSCENVYRHNTFWRCSGALTLRHGHRCRVEANFFIGERARGSGGVRIIGEDHVLVNNYFADLEGDAQRAAVCFMNGVPNSPLNEYFQVKRAKVIFNTFVDCKRSLVIGQTDEDAQTVLPPEDCLIANNAIHGRRSPLVEIQTAPVRMTWTGNLFGGDGARDVAESFGRKADGWEFLVEAPSSVRRPKAGSPLFGAAVGEFPDVHDDLDGQPRSAPLDVGCDQRSSLPVLNRPLALADVGPAWIAEKTSPPAPSK